MKSAPTFSLTTARRGAALLIALTFLVLLSAVVLALFSNSWTDRRNASVFASGQETQRLVETAVNLVQGQIRDATTQPRVSWASQPGMVRSFDTTGRPTAYKLYSADAMVVPDFGAAEISSEFSALQNWNAGAVGSSANAVYADLNAPAVVRRPNLATADLNDSTVVPVFPIVDPAVIGRVDGFSAATSVAGTVLGSGTDRRLPMPVRWIYVLKDGQMVTPSASSSATRAVFSGSVQPTANNPIVGRMAFWTDDETAKLNINTASEGSFWDVPRMNLQREGLMAWRMPVRGEFQAISGHPATTSLSTVLGSVLGNPASPLPVFGVTTTDYTNYFAPYYRLTPRISDQTEIVSGLGTTSRAGSVDTTAVSMTDGASGTPRGQPVIFDTDRLYATADELLYKPDRTLNDSKLTAAEVAVRKFFLTSHSRAPETNLFGLPRVSLWPFQRLPSDIPQTSRDQLLAFCGKIGGRNYFFERESISVSQAGNNNTSSANSLSADYTAIPRNQELYSYLNNLMAQTLPGYGAALTGKWSTAGAAQVATMSFDYLRSGANLYQTPNRTGGSNPNDTSRKNPGSWGYEVAVPFGQNQGGYITPLKIGNTRGMGRMAYITEVAVVYIATAADATSRKTTKMQAFLAFTLYRPGPTSGAASPAMFMTVAAPSLNISGSIRHGTRNGGSSGTGRNYSFVGVHGLFYRTDNFNPRTAGRSNPDTEYPFYSDEVDVTGQDTFTFPGGTVTVSMREVFGSSPQTYQTLTFDLGAPVTLPVPQAVSSTSPLPANGAFDLVEALNLTQRLSTSPQTGFIRQGDIVRSARFRGNAAAPHKGDLRLLAFTDNVPTSWFEPHPWNTASVTAYVFDASGNVTNVQAARQNRFASTLRNDSSTVLYSQYNQRGQYGWTNGVNNMDTTFYTVPYNINVHPSDLVAGFDSAQPPATRVNLGGLIANLRFGDQRNAAATPVAPKGLSAALNSAGQAGDFGAGYGPTPDGAVVTIPDFGSFRMPGGGFYDGETNYRDDGGPAAEPNRQLPSPAIFGSLPSVDSSGALAPWQSLLFGARPSAGGTHPGFGTGVGGSGPSARAPFSIVPDHVFLDFWWMPAVDPYAISEPLSTAGKVNLNYQILPFSHITRSTGLQGLMKSVRLAGISDSDSIRYKRNATDITSVGSDKDFFTDSTSRFHLNRSDVDGSLKGFADRFAAGDIFRSASEICTIPLVAQGETVATMNTWWNARRLTSDTFREQPYVAMYSRVTTKSNTYTVNYRVQALKQVTGVGRNWAEWNEGRDQIVGEYQGSTTIERFLDPNATGLPDYSQVNLAGAYEPVDTKYRWRVLSQKQFSP